jgi:hypothetical protein
MWAAPSRRCTRYKTHAGPTARLSKVALEVTGPKPRAPPPHPAFAGEPRTAAIPELPRHPILSSHSSFSCAQLIGALNVPESTAAVELTSRLIVYSLRRTPQSPVRASSSSEPLVAAVLYAESCLRPTSPPVSRAAVSSNATAGRTPHRFPSQPEQPILLAAGAAAAQSWPGKAWPVMQLWAVAPWAMRLGRCPGAVVGRGRFSPLAI